MFGLAATVAAIPLVYMFARREVALALQEEPWQMVALFTAGTFASVAAAYIPGCLGLKRLGISGSLAELIGGAVAGICIGLVASVAGWFAATYSLWALLLWFVLCPITMGLHATLLGRGQRDG